MADYETVYDPYIDDLETKIDTGMQSRNEELRSLYSPRTTDISDVIAQAIITLGPIVAGYALDKERGAAAGAQAGLIGNQVYGKSLLEERGREDKLREANIQREDELLKSRLGTREDLYKEALKAKQSNQEAIEKATVYEPLKIKQETEAYRQRRVIDKEMGVGGHGGAREPMQVSEETVQDIARTTGRDPELVRSELNRPTTEVFALNQYRYGVGGNTKLPEVSIVEDITVAKNLRQQLNEMNSALGEMKAENKSNLEIALRSGQATGAINDPASPEYRYFVSANAAQRMIARLYDSGALSKIDVDTWGPFVKGSVLYDTPETRETRINNLYKFVNGMEQNLLEAAGQGGRNVSRFLDSSATQQDNNWIDKVDSGVEIMSPNIIKRPATIGGVTYQPGDTLPNGKIYHGVNSKTGKGVIGTP